MRSKEDINAKLLELMNEVNDLTRKKTESNFTGAVASLQEIINCKRHAIAQLVWVLDE